MKSAKSSGKSGQRGPISRKAVAEPIEEPVKVRTGVRDLNPAERSEVVRVVLLLGATLGTAFNMDKQGVCRTIRWAAHVIETSKEL